MDTPRVIIAGLRGGGGKTLVSVGLIAALRRRGVKVSAFKKGPDYIDAAWLSRAAQSPCRNLDLFMMSPEAALGSFAAAAWASAAATAPSDLAVIEGNRGLYDGMDASGTYSTAELAKLLQAPVLLTVDCTKSTRTVAAAILGCQRLDSDVPIGGVILNRLAGDRHESVIREAIAEECGLPVVGALPRLPSGIFPERHLGLVPPQEHGEVSGAIEEAAGVVEEQVDIDGILQLARKAPPLEVGEQAPAVSAEPVASIGVFRDAAFQFYYPENLEALAREGGRIVEISPLEERELPEVDALYIGGGFPETLAPRLSANTSFRESVRRAIEKGLPAYAECGGLVYLGERLVLDGGEHPMTGVLPVVFGMGEKPRGHGYAVVETVGENPFFPVGESFRGHEFHYTHVLEYTADDLRFAFRVQRGYGFDGERDGLCHRNVLASYTHLHALGVEGWAGSIVREGERFRRAAR